MQFIMCGIVQLTVDIIIVIQIIIYRGNESGKSDKSSKQDNKYEKITSEYK